MSDGFIKVVFILLVSFLIALYSNDSKAGDFSVITGGFSYHYDRDYDYNESHDLLGLCYKKTCIASYKNSYNVKSYLAYSSIDLMQYGKLNVNIKYGLMGGYKGHEKIAFSEYGIIPMIGVGFDYEIYNGVTLQSNITPSVLMFNLKINL